MKVFLLHPDRDFEVKPELRDSVFDAMRSGQPLRGTRPRRELDRQPDDGAATATATVEALIQDLELDTVCGAMAAGDGFLFETAKRALLSSLHDPQAIAYRQRVLADCIGHVEIVQRLYEIAIEALASERELGGLWSGSNPRYILTRSVRQLALYLGALKRLREIADQHSRDFRSPAFTRFFAMLREELDDTYLTTVERQLRELEFKRGVLDSAELGKGDKARRHVLHRPPAQRHSWRDRLAIGTRPTQYSFELHPRDDAGLRALKELEAKAINSTADAVAQSADHIHSFFAMLRLELAFYLGCVNLHQALKSKEEPTCFPEATVCNGRPSLTARGLYDVCLTLHLQSRTADNDITADGKTLAMITGANQGGKSTLLRGLGVAQLMMQSGMFVGAESFRASICAGLFTHYKREEDEAMEGGKLDEELRRMSQIADQITPGAVLLCNESFASTNEREGSEIARQVVRAMLARQVRVYFVTHMFDLAHSFHAQQLDTTLFLRAEREPDGARTFKLRERRPLPTSYGQDSYRRIFGDDDGVGSYPDS